MKKGTGYRPDPASYHRPKFQRLPAHRMGASLPMASSMFQWAPTVFNQGGTSSCTGASTAQAIYTALNAAGNPLPWVPSPKGIYTLGRAIDRSQDANGELPVLGDDGAMPSQVMRGISEWGVHPMGPLVPGYNYDCDESNVNEEPTLGDLEQDAKALIVGEYGVYSTGPQRITDICTAIAARKPVTCAIAGGSDAFQRYTGGVLGAPHAPLDHYVWLAAFYTDATGRRVFTGRNSWSEGWGESGNFRLSEDAVQELGDVVVLDIKVQQ